MKKLLSLITVFALLFCLAACGNGSDPVNGNPTLGEMPPSDSSQTELGSAQDPSSSPAENSAPENEPTETGRRALVVYFSHSGNTESVAKEIQTQTGADIFEIVPATPYTTDYNTLLDVAQNEQKDNARPGISGSIEDIAQYDVIYLGYPNWWADMPMVVYTFLDSYDLSGKTIAPFVTSGGSGFSNTIDTIQSMEPNATLTEGLAIRDSEIDANMPDEVSAWLSANEIPMQ